MTERRRLLGQVGRFALVGAASTLAYLGLYMALRLWLEAGWSNLIALLATTIANTATNRRLTFGVRGRQAWVRQQAQGLLVFGIALTLGDGALAVLHTAAHNPPRVAELGALVAANVLSTAARFVALRIWVFRPTPERASVPAGDA